MTQNNKKSNKQFFSVAGIDWDDDASIDAWARAVWGVMNTQREEEMNNKKIEAPEPTIKLTGKYVRAVSYANKHHKKQTPQGKRCSLHLSPPRGISTRLGSGRR